MSTRLLRVVPVPPQGVRLLRATDEPVAHQLLQRRSRREGDILDSQRRERGRQIGGDELEDVLRLGESAELLHAEVAQCRSLRQRVANAARGGRGKQRLSAVSRRGNPLGAREGERGDVVSAARLRRSRVQTHSHAYRSGLTPAFAMERALRIERRVEGAPAFSNTEQNPSPTTWNTRPPCVPIARSRSA